MQNVIMLNTTGSSKVFAMQANVLDKGRTVSQCLTVKLIAMSNDLCR